MQHDPNGPVITDLIPNETASLVTIQSESVATGRRATILQFAIIVAIVVVISGILRCLLLPHIQNLAFRFALMAISVLLSAVLGCFATQYLDSWKTRRPLDRRDIGYGLIALLLSTVMSGFQFSPSTDDQLLALGYAEANTASIDRRIQPDKDEIARLRPNQEVLAEARVLITKPNVKGRLNPRVIALIDGTESLWTPEIEKDFIRVCRQLAQSYPAHVPLNDARISARNREGKKLLQPIADRCSDRGKAFAEALISDLVKCEQSLAISEHSLAVAQENETVLEASRTALEQRSKRVSDDLDGKMSESKESLRRLKNLKEKALHLAVQTEELRKLMKESEAAMSQLEKCKQEIDVRIALARSNREAVPADALHPNNRGDQNAMRETLVVDGNDIELLDQADRHREKLTQLVAVTSRKCAKVELASEELSIETAVNERLSEPETESNLDALSQEAKNITNESQLLLQTFHQQQNEITQHQKDLSELAECIKCIVMGQRILLWQAAGGNVDPNVFEYLYLVRLADLPVTLPERSSKKTD